jgi:glucose/arabinose dehydrogenase
MRKLLYLIVLLVSVNSIASDSTNAKRSSNYNAVNAGLTLPLGFNASMIADSGGRTRDIVVNNGDVFVKVERLVNGKGIFQMRDKDGDGKIDETIAFGNYRGTGLTMKNGYLYASSYSDVYRYKLDADGNVLNPDQPETIVTGLVNAAQHNTKSIVLDNSGNIYVNVGAPSNSCQQEDRKNGSKGMDPCPILETAGGIWQFKADKLNQTYADGVRYATGIRNVVGLDWNNSINELFVMQHGRDQLDMFPQYTAKENADRPAEEMFLVKKGFNGGWPYCYFDLPENKKILAPEYGGDKKTQGRCAELQPPVIAFPAHMAPNALLFYKGNQFPEKYKNGAFIAFHGSWNRSPEKQEGYYVAFVPFKDGKPNGKWEVFADGFAGVDAVMSTRQAKHRPCGLAEDKDGSLYITDDVKGTIYKIVYNGK